MDTNELNITIEDRVSGQAVIVGGVTWEVERMEWRAMGGPWKARMIARAKSLAELWALVDLLRCGVTVNDERGPAWWGYLAGVEVVNGARRVRVGLEEMGNRVAISYRDFYPTLSGGEPKTTAFLEQRDSVKVYGVKERVYSIGQASAGDALVLRARKLGDVGLPVKAARILAASKSENGPVAIVDCLGWWETLDWKLANEARGLIANSAAGADQKFGRTDEQRVGQTFVIGADGWQAAEVWMRVRRELAPADGVTLQLCPDSGGTPGAALASATVAAGDIDDGYQWVRFAFSSPVALSGGAYWLTLQRTGALNNDLYYAVSADQGQGYADGQAYVYRSGSWNAREVPADFNMYIVGVEETIEQVRRLLAAERCGQFLRELRIETTSGILTRMYRDGKQRGMKIIEGLLELGTAQGRKLLGRVEYGRKMRIYRQLLSSTAGRESDVLINPAGELCSMDGRRLPASRWPAGLWAVLGELEGAVFVERCVWEGGRMTMT